MRQSVQALCVVTFDAPAETDVHHLWDDVADALISGSHAKVEPTVVELRALIEEGAMFNNNGDQWEAEAGPVLRRGEEAIVLSPIGGKLDSNAVHRRAHEIAEALNFTAGRVAPIPSDVLAALKWATGMAAEALAMREESEDAEDTSPEMLALHHEELAKARALIAGAPKPEAAPAVEPAPPLAIACANCGNDGGDIDALILGVDARWSPVTQVWTLHENDEGVDCLACDTKTRIPGRIFPDGIEIAPGGLIVPRYAEDSEKEEMARILDGVLGVIDMTNPYADDFADSAADTIDALTDWEKDIREVLGREPGASEEGTAA